MLGLLLAGILVVADEMRTSRWQAGYFSQQAKQMQFWNAPGVSDAVAFPKVGPYDTRLGYTQIDPFSTRLLSQGYEIESQARMSPTLLHWVGYGITPPYAEKAQAGLTLLQRDNSLLLQQRVPARVLQDFAALAPLAVEMLLFIESRELLDPARPTMNPAVEWDRLGKALLEKGQQLLGGGESAAGGSTLATQLAKFRHSAGGVTNSTSEKLRQMLSASLRAYQGGIHTLAARQQIVVDYLNGVPLAASPGYGEVIGLGDGLWVWYGTEIHTAMQQLREPATDSAQLAAQGLALKQILSLFIAHRRPSEFLLQERATLETKTDLYVRLLYEAKLLPETLYTAARAATLTFRIERDYKPATSLGARKALNVVRYPLLRLLEVGQLYDLERLDLTVKSTLDLPAQIAATEVLEQLHDPDAVKALHLSGKRLLNPSNDPSAVLYSLVLYEKTQQGNVLRVQTDNYDQPLDINDGVKLDLGSTAKLRTLITYLQLVAELHEKYEFDTPETLKCLKLHPQDAISRWVVATLQKTPNISLRALLEAAMLRPYSASSGEMFFTGGAQHTFHNFSKKTAGTMPLAHAFRNSVNLVFIRLMRDIVRHYMYRPGNLAAEILTDPNHPLRQVYLAQYAEIEGGKHVRRYYRKYAGKPLAERWESLLSSVRMEPRYLVALHRYLYPQASPKALAEFLQTQLPTQTLSPETLQALAQTYTPDNYTLLEYAALLRLHPLELWLFAHLEHNPKASLSTALQASAPASQQAFAYLTRSKRKKPQELRIRRMLEVEAYTELHQAWQALGYPFAALVPSYATALGSSADRPGALAELMGILANDGVKLPTYRLAWLHFAADTPYDTRFTHTAAAGERVMPAEVAQVVKQALYDVVNNGTARSIKAGKDLNPKLRVGGKTGTGDHRREIYGRGGRRIRSQVISRTATFVFMLDERFFGAVVAYVPGEQAEKYQFTSALAVTVLRQLLPSLQPLLSSPPE